MPNRPMSAIAAAAWVSDRQGALRTAEVSSAEQKWTTVGVLNVAVPSRLDAVDVLFPSTSVMTTNINPVNAPADEPVMT